MSNVSKQYTVDTSLIDDHKTELFISLMEELDSIGCIISPDLPETNDDTPKMTITT